MPRDRSKLLVVDNENALDGRQFVIEQQATLALIRTRDARIERRFGAPVQIKVRTGRGCVPQIERQIHNPHQATDLIEVAAAAAYGGQREMVLQRQCADFFPSAAATTFLSSSSIARFGAMNASCFPSCSLVTESRPGHARPRRSARTMVGPIKTSLRKDACGPCGCIRKCGRRQ